MQEEALKPIVASLKKDPVVKAIFLKGSMGRGEHDQHSDIDLYCFVNEENKQQFLKNRKKHLTAYRPLLMYDEIYIIAPQIVAVYDNLLHIDLFTVTEESLLTKDFFTVLYDPENHLEAFQSRQTLGLSIQEFDDAVMDAVWFLFQYKKSTARGNDLWAVHMLEQAFTHFAKVLLRHYVPARAQLGLKTMERSLPAVPLNKFNRMYEANTPNQHPQAAKYYCQFLSEEKEWILANMQHPIKIQPLFLQLIQSW
ncbi:nucleotidyltransferase domain-containing protein [Paraliobacillus ryukyuensis]|nr:nucleotidyltransferase domain-containing protein [Paraliobacillus ryukyuensis]